MIRSSDYLKPFHYCKHCDSDFRIDLGNASGDFFLVCPKCKWQHYRHYENGVAKHCDLLLRKSDPIKIEGT